MGSPFIPCFNLTMVNPNRIWQTDNVLKVELPLLAAQICFNILMYRCFFFIYKPIHQPRIISQICVGLLLTPLLFGRFPEIFAFFFPINGVLNIEVLSHIGLMYYAFLSGLEMNLDTILHLKKKGASIAVAGILFPTVMGPILYRTYRYFYVGGKDPIEPPTMNAYLLWTLVLTVTGFPVIAQILSELKLLYTGLGKAAITAAVIGDTYGWFLFTLLVPFSINGTNAIYSVLSTLVFIFICIILVRPLIVRIIDRKTERDEWDDNQLIFVVMGLFVCSFITDILGTHGIVGAFVYGLILPHGKFADTVASISDDFGNGILAPMFFGGTGMRLMIQCLIEGRSGFGTILVIVLLCLPKILGTMFVTFFFGMRTLDGFSLGLLLNTKGAMALIMLNIAWDRSRPSHDHRGGSRHQCHLVELTGRGAALVAAHMVNPGGQPGAQNLTKSQAELESISNTFDAFGEAYDAVRVQTLNVVSAYATIHEDIYNSANEKRTSLILLPFHKHISSEGALEVTSGVYRDINMNIMQSAPCSVGIFVDRDLGSLPKMNFRILMLFVGGPDDREALAIAWRMAGHPGIRLSVTRILLFDDAAEVDTSNHGEAQGVLSAVCIP